jgi:hypothetical protein
VNKVTVRRQGFRYDVEHQENLWKQRMAGFEGLVIKANQGDVEPLIDHLTSSDNEDDRNLAWLLDRWHSEGRLPRRHHRSLSDKNFAVACAAYLVWVGKRAWCRHHGYKIVSKKNTPMKKLAARAIELVAPRFESVRDEIKRRAVLKRQRFIPSSEIREHVREFMPGAVEAIIKEAKAEE